MRFSHGELIMSLAVTKRIAREANALMWPAISRRFWADLLVKEMSEEKISKRSLFGDQGPRKMRHLASMYFHPLKLSDDEIVAAIARAKRNV
jgi:hypothetical protein